MAAPMGSIPPPRVTPIKVGGAGTSANKGGTPRPGARPEGAPKSTAVPRGRVAPPKKKKARPIRARPEAILVRVPEGGTIHGYLQDYGDPGACGLDGGQGG